MPLNQDKLQSPIRKLRKSLKKPPSQPSPEQVHKLRTRSRRVQAIMAALSLEQQRDARRMLNAISSIRKKAGKVRDMDVLMGHAATLHDHGEEECLIQLLEHLGSERSRLSRKLVDTIQKEGETARRGLKDYSEAIRNLSGTSEKNSVNLQEPTAVALGISVEISAWPKLNRGNLHAFRLKIKELQYILQLAEAPDRSFISSLGQVKDAIGEWHDWYQLAELSGAIFGYNRLKLVQYIREIVETKLQRALTLANRTRRRYFAQPRIGTHRRKSPASLNESAIATAAKLVA